MGKDIDEIYTKKYHEKRKGGISHKAWDGLKKSEIKGLHKAGITKYGGPKNHLFEQGVWEMGYGNIDNAEDLREAWRNFSGRDKTKLNDWDDVSGFRSDVGNDRWRRKEKAKREKEKAKKEKDEDKHNPQELDVGDWQSQYLAQNAALIEQIANLSAYTQPRSEGWSPRGGW